MEYITSSTEETKKLAIELAKNLSAGDVVLLYGDLGSGKTTFARFLVESMGFTDRVQSPTFVLSRVYKKNEGGLGIDKIYHLDLYRITSEDDIADLDLPQYFSDEKALTLVEWPKIAGRELPKNCIKIGFEYVGENERKINVQGIN